MVIDDASTDDTPLVVQKYTSNDQRIRLIQRSAKGGIATARNHGIRESRGLFVTFLDSDDEYDADHLSSRRQMLLDNDNVQMLHGGYRVVGSPWVVDKDDPSRMIHIENCVVGGTFVIRRDVFEQIGDFDDGKYADDALFYERATKAAVSIGRTDHASYVYYRDRFDQLTSPK